MLVVTLTLISTRRPIHTIVCKCDKHCSNLASGLVVSHRKKNKRSVFSILDKLFHEHLKKKDIIFRSCRLFQLGGGEGDSLLLSPLRGCSELRLRQRSDRKERCPKETSEWDKQLENLHKSGFCLKRQ